MTANLDEARKRLRKAQQPEAGLEPTLASFRRRTTYELVADEPERVRRGEFSFHRNTEDERIARGEALIRRVDPGPFEDPEYLARLAFEAASVEIAWRRLPNEVDFGNVLIGTAHAAKVNALTRRYEDEGYITIVINSGAVDFIYEATRALVEMQDPQRVAERRTRTTISAEEVSTRVADNPRLADRLYDVLAAYYFDGYPRVSSPEVPEQQESMLTLVSSLALRWIVGHEYGHGLLAVPDDPPEGVNPLWAAEFSSDELGMVATVISGSEMDGAAPDICLGAAKFAIACWEMLELTRLALLDGDDDQPVDGTPTHPAYDERSDALVAFFERDFSCRFDDRDPSWWDLTLDPFGATPNGHRLPPEKLPNVNQYADVLKAMWPAVKERLLSAKTRRTLHPIWTER